MEWLNYEELTVDVLKRFFKGVFNVDDFFPKSKLLGQRSGTNWEVDGSGKDALGNILIIECKRYGKTSMIKQEIMGGLAYRKHDINALGAIMIVPTLKQVQSGAKKVAAAEGIEIIELNPNSNEGEFLAKYINKYVYMLEDSYNKQNISDSIEQKIGIKFEDEYKGVSDGD